MWKGYKSICQIRAGSLVRQSVGLLRYSCCDLLTRDTQRSRVQLPPGPRASGAVAKSGMATGSSGKSSRYDEQRVN